MAVYCISYTLSSNSYEKLSTAIQDYGTWWHESGSVWFIETNQDAKQVLNNLRNYIANGDKILVIEVKKHWWGIGFTQEEYDWMKSKVK